MIYLITNTINKKKYVGKTTNLQRRWYRHCKAAEYGSKTHFHKAIRKYGAEVFKVELLDGAYSNEAEIMWIDCVGPEYNMTKGGDGGWINDQTGKKWKVKNTAKMRNTFKNGGNHTEKWKQSVTGSNNYQCKYEYFTPWGKFDTLNDALQTAKGLRKNGRKDVVTDRSTLKKYCFGDIILHKEGRRTFSCWRGKSTKQIGFYIKEKTNGSCE